MTIVFIIPYTFLLLLAPFLQSRSHWYGCHWINKFKPFLDCYYAPFKDRYRFWSGVLPVTRFPLYLVFILSENTTFKLWVIIIVTYMYMVALMSLSVYRKWVVLFLEVLLLMSLSTLCIAVLNNPSFKVIGFDIVITVVVITLFVMLGILGYHGIKKLVSTCVLFVTHSDSDEERSRSLLLPDALPHVSVNPVRNLPDLLGVGLREPLSEEY